MHIKREKKETDLKEGTVYWGAQPERFLPIVAWFYCRGPVVM